MAENINFSQRIKEFFTKTIQCIRLFFQRIRNSETMRKIIGFCKWENLRPRLIQAKEAVILFTKEQPKTAAFICVPVLRLFHRLSGRTVRQSRFKDVGKQHSFPVGRNQSRRLVVFHSDRSVAVLYGGRRSGPDHGGF